ncbi:insulin-like growth factor-binding protein complex acid labile subunit [Aplysia californica]|uniref:Insulin-like growth factor-binding protein complex acid labile subunit n=1 Tax=Aplysia californica TaxID=6500 RepID=A0ABM0JXD3_APLCA|nr:insulin-like growth factor-binding protein complex acid labile subunit [Aplysia californica]
MASRQPSTTLLVFLKLLCLFFTSYEHVEAAQTLKCSQLLESFTQCNCSSQFINGVETLDPVLDCSNRNLLSVPDPQSFDFTIAEYRLNDNRITSLQASAFAGLRIRSLDLSGNNIGDVSPDAFLELQNYTQTLILQGDGRVSPPKSAFLKLPYLESLTLKKYSVNMLGDNQEHSFFLAFSLLSTLTLDNCGITSIEPEAFNGPTKLETLNILNQPLVEMPIDALRSTHIKHLKKLFITGTRISAVTYEVFEKMNKIEEIDLSGNEIGDIEEYSFRGVGDTLKKLTVSNNVITSSRVQGLRDIASLTHLDMSRNPDLTSLPNLSQLGSTDGLDLYLDNCDIFEVRETELAGVASTLRSLDLTGNRISVIHANAFTGVTQLQVLRLDNQRGVSRFVVPTSLAQAKSSLQELYISGQVLDATSLWQVVSQLTNLRVLNLATAGLAQIPDRVLEQLSLLQELHLDDNRLTALTQESLLGPMRSLRSLYLSGNLLTTLPHCLLHQYELPSPPLEMSLNGNPLICDCRLRWILAAVRDNKVTFNSGAEPTCSPDNSQLLDKSEAALTCNNSFMESPCEDYYVSSTISPGDTTPESDPLRVDATRIEEQSISISWSISITTGLSHFKVEVRDEGDNVVFRRDNLATTTTSAVATGLIPGGYYSYCVFAVYSASVSPDCGTARTLGGGQDPDKQTDGISEEEIGIIVGAVVGAVLLLVLLGAILYLAVIRRRRDKKLQGGPASSAAPAHVQPRAFAKSELPGMATTETRTFTRPKKPPGQAEGRAQGGGRRGDEEQGGSMQVLAISDGMTGSGNVGRAHRLLSNDGYKDMSGSSNMLEVLGVAKEDGKDSDQSFQSIYENDHGPLPPTPSSAGNSRPPSYGAYYNEGYQGDKYDQIHEREVNL